MGGVYPRGVRVAGGEPLGWGWELGGAKVAGFGAPGVGLGGRGRRRAVRVAVARELGAGRAGLPLAVGALS